MRTSKLKGIALDWAVAKCEDLNFLFDKTYPYTKVTGIYINGFPSQEFFSPSTSWAQGGPIIEREGIDVFCTLIGRPDHENEAWRKSNWRARFARMGVGTEASFGNTPLEAAMRCYVASKLGDEVEIPEELQS